jgi:peptidoglycan/LPS O-acetylase OafA/YrhL
MTYAGDISYPLYLIHIPIFRFAFWIWPGVPAWATIVTCLLAAAALLHMVDYPARRRWGTKHA